jgi:two-component system, LytTR family, sensor kinase
MWTARLLLSLPAPAGVVLEQSVLRFVAAVALYALLAAAGQAVLYARDRRQSALVARGLRSALSDAARQRAHAELRALKAELNPHFVGNALHTATALVCRDPEAAEHMLRALAALAREAATRTSTQEVTLAEELSTLEPFLAIERARLGLADGALTVDWEVAPELLDASVPHFVLQPLVENAVRHGLAPRGGAGRLTVRARRASAPGNRAAVAAHERAVDVHPIRRRKRGVRADASPAAPAPPAISWIELAVVDDGVGLAATRAAHASRPGTGGVGAGAGVRGIHSRLAELYGPEALFELVSGDGPGTVARLVIPHRVARPDVRQ